MRRLSVWLILASRNAGPPPSRSRAPLERVRRSSAHTMRRRRSRVRDGRRANAGRVRGYRCRRRSHRGPGSPPTRAPKDPSMPPPLRSAGRSASSARRPRIRNPAESDPPTRGQLPREAPCLAIHLTNGGSPRRVWAAAAFRRRRRPPATPARSRRALRPRRRDHPAVDSGCRRIACSSPRARPRNRD
jgi:hypothetical protein